jgi:poly(hydroxyalkanoate) granule-associated protein
MFPENLEKTIRESTHRLWLAGLGALALAEEKKNGLMDRLVEKGQSHKLHDRDPSQIAAEVLDNCRKSAESYRTSIESIIETKLSEATRQLGLASRKEIDQVAQRLEKLSKLLGTLMEKNHADQQETPEKKAPNA